MRTTLAAVAAMGFIIATVFATPTPADARCQGCLEGPMLPGAVPYYAPAYYEPYYRAPRYYHAPRRYIRYAPYYYRHDRPRHYDEQPYYVRPYYLPPHYAQPWYIRPYW